MAIYNLTQEELQSMSFFDLQRRLEWAITDYNKTFNRPTEIRVVIYEDVTSGFAMTMPDEFLNDAKKLARNYMKRAISDMELEYRKRFKENEGYSVEYSDTRFDMDMLFKSLEEQNKEMFDKKAESYE